MLMIGGELRPMLHAAVATEIMFYHERFLAKEMHSVLTCMREAYSAIGASGEDAHAKIIEWGVAIHVKFDVDNLHLTEKESHTGHEKVVHAVKQLGSSHATQAIVHSSLMLQLAKYAWRVSSTVVRHRATRNGT